MNLTWKYFVLFFIVITHDNPLFGQRIDMFLGGNRNTFFGSNAATHTHIYKPGFGISFGIGIDSLVSGSLKTRLALHFDSYGGRINVREGGVSHGKIVEAEIRKSVISFNAFPLNLRIKKKFDLNLGISFGALINEKYSGVIHGFDPITNSYSYDINDKYDRFSSSMYIGFSGRIAYDFYLTNSLALSPQYMIYYGRSAEFIEFPKFTRSMRHSLCIAIRKKINRKSK